MEWLEGLEVEDLNVAEDNLWGVGPWSLGVRQQKFGEKLHASWLDMEGNSGGFVGNEFEGHFPFRMEVLVGDRTTWKGFYKYRITLGS